MKRVLNVSDSVIQFTPYLQVAPREELDIRDSELTPELKQQLKLYETNNDIRVYDHKEEDYTYMLAKELVQEAKERALVTPYDLFLQTPLSEETNIENIEDVVNVDNIEPEAKEKVQEVKVKKTTRKTTTKKTTK